MTLMVITMDYHDLIQGYGGV